MFLHGKVNINIIQNFVFNKSPQYSSLLGCKFFSCFSNKKHVTSDKDVSCNTDMGQQFYYCEKSNFGEAESAKCRFSIALKNSLVLEDLAFWPSGDAKFINPTRASVCSFWPISLILYRQEELLQLFFGNGTEHKGLFFIWIHHIQTTIFNQQKKRPSQSQF